MHKLRFAVLIAGAALALGVGTVIAAQSGAVGTGRDTHGDDVASAARTTCPSGPGHGDCVSAIASSEGQENRDGARADAVAACRAADAAEDAKETAAEKAEDASEKTAKLTKAAAHTEDAHERAAKQSEDKAERAAFVACVTGHTGP